MSIQILGLRTFEKGGETVTTDCFHKNGWRAASVKDLFANIAHHVEQIPSRERWNLFYTLATCTDKKRDFESQAVIAFDIDGVQLERRREAGLVACGALGLDPKKTALVSSGGGLHVVVELASPITDRKFFKDYKADYGFACDRIAKALANAGIAHKVVDPVVFEPRRILRLPETENRKAGRDPARCTLIQSNLEPQEFDLRSFSPLGGPVTKSDALPPRAMARYSSDTPAVLEGCGFLKAARAEPHKVNEPQWYAALSIVGRLTEWKGKDGHALCHELSSGHPAYDPDETTKKIAQALDASGPRTCHNINALWGKCHECPHFEKVGSPIQIVSEGAIATELTGFHKISGNGKSTPAVEDLRLFFKREHHYRTMEGSRVVYGWSGTHYETWANNRLECFAHEHYEPKVKPYSMREFKDLVSGTGIVSTKWFGTSTQGLINFENGVLNVATGELTAHSPEVGFRHVLPYKYDPAAKCPCFDRMLQLVTGGDQSLQAILLEFIGYALSGDTYWCHKTLVLDGDGSNGKSTFIDVLKDLAGGDNFSMVAIKDLEHEYNRATLDGKLFNISEETPTKALMDASYFKAMSAGSGVQARHPYQEPFPLHNRAKFMLSCNNLPESMDTSFGLIRRLLIVPFRQTITKETVPDFDPYLGTKLKDELPGIFNLALAGYHRLKRQGGFSESVAAASAVKEYEASINTVITWFREEVVDLVNGHANHFTPLEDLYAHYKLWTRSMEIYPIQYPKFTRNLRKIMGAEYDKKHMRKRHPEGGRDANPKSGLLGIGLARDFGDHAAQAEHHGPVFNA